jgi:hypothetical protein
MYQSNHAEIERTKMITVSFNNETITITQTIEQFTQKIELTHVEAEKLRMELISASMKMVNAAKVALKN